MKKRYWLEEIGNAHPCHAPRSVNTFMVSPCDVGSSTKHQFCLILNILLYLQKEEEEEL